MKARFATVAWPLETMAASHDVTARLALSGSSRELDALTETFNALMASVADAEAQTQAAYTGAIHTNRVVITGIPDDMALSYNVIIYELGGTGNGRGGNYTVGPVPRDPTRSDATRRQPPCRRLPCNIGRLPCPNIKSVSPRPGGLRGHCRLPIPIIFP